MNRIFCRRSHLRLILAAMLGTLGVTSLCAPAYADPPWARDGGPGWHGRGPGGPGWRHGWRHDEDRGDWRGGYRGPRGYYPPPPPVFYAPPPPPPPPVYYAPPPPAYYGPPTLSFGVNIPFGH